MEGKVNEQPGILFDDHTLQIIPLDEPSGENGKHNGPSKYDGEPVSRQVIHTPRMRTDSRFKPKPDGQGHGDKLLLVMTVVAVLVAFIALLIGGLGLSRRGDIFVNVSSGTSSPTVSGPDTATGSYSGDNRVWLFAIGNYGVRLEYIDTASGEVRGYNVDIINAVCRIASKNCELVWDAYEHCWQNVAGHAAVPGIGLQGGWYDACTAWSVTYARVRTFKFTADMSKQHLSVFMVGIGKDPNSFNWRNLIGLVIGFLQSHVEDEICLRRYPQITGGNLSITQIQYYDSQQDLLTAVNNDEVDAVFINEYLDVTTYLQVASEKLDRCAIGGQAMMSRKDSALSRWWNPAFKTLLDSPEYLQICQGLEDENVHGSIPGPSLSQQCIGF